MFYSHGHSIPRCLYLHSAELLLRPGDFLTSIIYCSSHPATWGETFIFSPRILRRRRGSEFQLFVLERGSQNLECAGRKSQKQGYLYSPPSFTSLLLCFPLLLFLIKGGKRDDGAMIKSSPRVGVCAYESTCMLWEG